MKRILTLIALLSTGTLLHAQEKAAPREVSAAYDKIEANCKDWRHYTAAAENLEGGQAFENHAWISEDEDQFAKVETRHFDEHGDSFTQFFLKGGKLHFVLAHMETTPMLPKAPTSVVEQRFYYADGKLARVLAKKGSFPAGKRVDTSGIKNTEVPLSEVEGAAEHYDTERQGALGLIAKLKQINDDSAPAAGNAPAGKVAAGDGWRAIAGSQSRDGRFALAWGIKGQAAPAGEKDEDGTLSVDREEKGLTNYLVDLRAGKIVGPIVGKHFGDRSSYNHTNSETAWSYASNFVAQVNNGKWATFEAHVYHVTDADTVSVSKGTDLIAPVKKAIFEQLAGSDTLKKFDKEAFALALHDVGIVRRGGDTVIVVGVTGEIPKSEAEGSSFDATITFKIASDEKGGAPVLAWSGTEMH